MTLEQSKQRPLHGVKICLHRSISHLQQRLKPLQQRLTGLGASITTNVEDHGVTHIVVGEDGAHAPSTLEDILSKRNRKQHRHSSFLIREDWLNAVVTEGRRVPEQRYLVRLPGGSSTADRGRSTSPGAPGPGTPIKLNDRSKVIVLSTPVHTTPQSHQPAPEARMAQFAAWLGRWEPAFNHIHRLEEFVLQAKFDIEHGVSTGNEEVVQKLRELHKYEEAIGGNRGDPGQSEINRHALTYAHGAAVVRGCAFTLKPEHKPAFLERSLPFVGAFIAQLIHSLVATGSCEQLDAFRADLPVRNSLGVVREGTEGGASRRSFCRLPGVGATTAATWYRYGARSYEDVEALTEREGPLAPGSPHALSREAAYSLRRREQLLQDVSEGDIEEMRGEVLDCLAAVTAAQGWEMVMVGGGRRSKTAHDADFLVTHRAESVEGVAERLYLELVERGRLVRQEDGFCHLQFGRSSNYLEVAKRDIVLGRWVDRHQMDRYDHIWGCFITREGLHRRMDVMLVPHPQWVFALVGWTGSKQYLRFMRTHAGNCGMFLNSHYLMRRMTPGLLGQGGQRQAMAGEIVSVPDEAAPLDSEGHEFWPPGWQEGAKRRVETEEDLFQLLRIPYREPHERNCP